LKEFTVAKLSALEQVGCTFTAAATSLENLRMKDSRQSEKLGLLNPSELTRYMTQQENALKKSLEGLLKV
jgi:hypothetical protein